MNLIIKSVLEILGDSQPEGGYSFEGIPIFLNKDATTQYPEIRVSPYILNDNIHTTAWANKNLNKYRTYKLAKFQIDIYDSNLANVNQIHNNLESRIYDFMNLEILTYNYNKYFKKEKDYYKNISYGIGDLFKDIHSIIVEGMLLQRVLCLEKLVDDSFFVNKEALYIKTEKDLKTIEIKVLLQGRLFDNKDDFAKRNIISIEKNSSRNFSELEENEVERVSFDIDILFIKDVERDNILEVNEIDYKNKIK